MSSLATDPFNWQILPPNKIFTILHIKNKGFLEINPKKMGYLKEYSK